MSSSLACVSTSAMKASTLWGWWAARVASNCWAKVPMGFAARAEPGPSGPRPLPGSLGNISPMRIIPGIYPESLLRIRKGPSLVLNRANLLGSTFPIPFERWPCPSLR
ncbi:hypothetical protein D3C86_1157060 [compost metagenome]